MPKTDSSNSSCPSNKIFDSIIIILAIILNPRAERKRRRAAEELEGGAGTDVSSPHSNQLRDRTEVESVALSPDSCSPVCEKREEKEKGGLVTERKELAV